MSPELIAILGVGVALAALMFHILRRFEERLRQDIQRSEDRMRSDVHGSEDRMRSDVRGSEDRMRSDARGSEERMDSRFSAQDGRMAAQATCLSDLGERLARVEGLLEGLRDSITGRQAA